MRSDRTTANEWVTWKTEDGKLIYHAWNRYKEQIGAGGPRGIPRPANRNRREGSR